MRSTQLLPVVITPHRLANKRLFWSCCGLAVVRRSSSDWVRTRSGEWIKAPVQQARGLNKNSNRTLKTIFKGAAITVIGQRHDKTELRDRGASFVQFDEPVLTEIVRSEDRGRRTFM